MTVKPPPMFTDDAMTADKPRTYAHVCGSKPPPNMSMPPTAVSPEMALVTDIWKLGGGCGGGLERGYGDGRRWGMVTNGGTWSGKVETGLREYRASVAHEVFGSCAHVAWRLRANK